MKTYWVFVLVTLVRLFKSLIKNLSVNSYLSGKKSHCAIMLAGNRTVMFSPLISDIKQSSCMLHIRQNIYMHINAFYIQSLNLLTWTAMSESKISRSFREGSNDLNIYDPSNETIFRLRINKAFAVILCLISDTTSLRAFGRGPEEQSKNKVRETWSMKEPQTEVV